MCAHSPVLKDDQGNIGINGLRPEENGFRLLNAFVKRIGETDSPASGLRINLYRWLATAAAKSHSLRHVED